MNWVSVAMPTRRKTLGGGVGVLALLCGILLVGNEDGSEGDPDGSEEDVESEPETDSEPEVKAEPDPEPEPEAKPDPESEPNEGDARFETTVDFPDEDQRVSTTIEFGVAVENSGDAPDTYGVELELDRVDPDTDIGSGEWTLSGELAPGRTETHLVEHYYTATGTYEIRVDDEVVGKFDVLGGGHSRSTYASETETTPDDDDSTVNVAGHVTVNATEESAAGYDLD